MGRYTIGLDVGGTFTDCVVVDEDDRVYADKALTTPGRLTDGIIEAIANVASSLRCDRTALLSSTSSASIGTTSVLNRLLSRQGAKVGLLTTAGHEDAIIIGRGASKLEGLSPRERNDPVRWRKPDPIVPRTLICGIPERIDSRGRAVCPLNESQVLAASDRLVEAGVETIAICFLWSFRNPAHELRARDLILQRHPGVSITLSSEVAPVLGEYERTATTVINAYLRPGARADLESLATDLKTDGLQGEPLIMQSTGGVIDIESGAKRPVYLLSSGPVGGVSGAQTVGELLGCENIITTDMGGTSFDVGIIVKGIPELAKQPMYARYRVLVPALEVVSIGAGGGSIARVARATKTLHVGPDSAGSEPGPVCYGRGGTRPTVTDADLLLGRISPERFFGGRKHLDLEAARLAIREQIAEPLGLSEIEAAEGIVEIVDAHMGDLIRKASIERGYDPRDFTLFAFGGGGPLHVGGYGRDIGVSKAVIPAPASVFSAFGIALSDVVRNFSISRQSVLPLEPEQLRAIFDELMARVNAEVPTTVAEASLFKRTVDMRFHSQVHAVRVPLPEPLDDENINEELTERFLHLYEEIYGRGTAYREAGVEIVTFRLDVITPMTRPKLAAAPASARGGQPTPRDSRKVRFAGEWVETPVFDFESVPPESSIQGPACVEARTTTLLVHPGQHATTDLFGNIVLHFGQSGNEEPSEGANLLIESSLNVSPVTFEVLSHRLAMMVDEAAQVLKEVSGSPVAYEVGDCNAALMDADGNAIVIGPLLLSHALSGANVAKYVLENYHENPGIQPGDMFISNDPYRATPHQACVVVVSPIFEEGSLIAWSGAGIHLADVGGPVPGQVAVGAQSIFEEPTPMPPVKIVEGGVLRKDILEDWLVRGRTREANALDLRAKIAANHRLERRVREIIDRYGASTLRAVLAKIVDFTADTIRDRLRQIPDGTYSAKTILDYDDRGSLGLYHCRLDLTKANDRMLFDFSRSSPQAPGVINTTRAGLEIAVVHGLIALLTWDLPKCPAGIMKTYELTSRPGTFVHAQWPAGVTKATTSANMAIRQVICTALSRMFARSEAFEERVMAQGYVFSHLIEISGVRSRGEPFAACLLDHSQSSGSPALSSGDGVHTCGGVSTGGASLANVEAYEQRYPLMYLARREEVDTAGPGRYTGGSACYIMITPHDIDCIPDIVVHRHGVQVPSNLGIHGGLPGSTNQFVVKRKTNVDELLVDGVLPTRLEDLDGRLEVLPGITRTSLQRGDVYVAINGGGGGYGDPLERDFQLVEDDLALGYLSRTVAERVHGAVFGEDDSLDLAASRSRREEFRQLRLRQAGAAPGSHRGQQDWREATQRSEPVTDRVRLLKQDGGPFYGCRCGALLGTADRDYRQWLPSYDAPCTSAGPYCLNTVPEPPVVLRYYVCPNCAGLIEVDVAEVQAANHS